MVFRPERWLQSDTTEMEKHLLSFARGSRMCPGIKYVVPPHDLHSFIFAYLLFRKLSNSIANESDTDNNKQSSIRRTLPHHRASLPQIRARIVPDYTSRHGLERRHGT